MRTDHSIEAAIGLSVKLENLSRLWQEIFLPFYASEADVIALFEGRANGPRPRPPAARSTISATGPITWIHSSLFPKSPSRPACTIRHSKTAYFYADPKNNNDRTLYHEATHQLFNELRKVVAHPGERGNFWVLEGIATLMESLHQEGIKKPAEPGEIK